LVRDQTTIFFFFFAKLQHVTAFKGTNFYPLVVAKTGDTGIPGLRHFLYKSRTNVQFTMPELTDPYTSLTARKRLMRQYQHMNERMHRKTRSLKLLFHVGEFETMLGWVRPKKKKLCGKEAYCYGGFFFCTVSLDPNILFIL